MFAVHLVPGQPRALTVSGQFAGTPTAQQAATGLCAALAASYGEAA